MKSKVVRNSVTRAELIGVPHFSQGHVDSLCAYYAMSMMIAGLFPAQSTTVHGTPELRLRDNPIFQAVRRLYPTEKRYKEKVGDWCLYGLTMADATRIINECAQQLEPSPGRHFLCWAAKARRVKKLRNVRKVSVLAATWNVSEVIRLLDSHLPVIVANGGLGAHAVLAVGYISGGSAGRLIRVLDPMVVHPEWRQASQVFVDDAQIIVPNPGMFLDYRPALAITSGGSSLCKVWSRSKGRVEQ